MGKNDQKMKGAKNPCPGNQNQNDQTLRKENPYAYLGLYPFFGAISPDFVASRLRRECAGMRVSESL